MGNKRYILIAIGFIAVAGVVRAAHWPGGSAGMVIVFFGMIIAPGFLLMKLLLDGTFDTWEIYPLSFVLGASCFGALGILMFMLRAPVDAAYLLTSVASLIFAAFLYKKKKRPPSVEKLSVEFSGLAWAFAIVVILSVVVSAVLGGFRGWGVEWDYYTYITMVRRLVERGVAANFPLAYVNEGHDPIHSYNVWALMWAAVSRAAHIDPVELYIESAVVTIPAAILAFYSLVKTLFGRYSAMASAVCYVLYHFIAMGFILLGRTSFYNADPAWLIFFPTAGALGWRYVEEGGKGNLAGGALAVAGCAMVHPLWGALAGLLLLLVAWVTATSEAKSESVALHWAARLGWLLVFIPVLWTLLSFADGAEIVGGHDPPSWWGLSLFVILPVLLFIPRFVETAMNLPERSRRSVRMLIACALVTAPVAVPRFIVTRGVRSGEMEAIKPYHWFVTDRLFVLHPYHVTYTAPDMTLFPWIVLGVAALPWLVRRYRRCGSAAYLLVAAAIVIIPLVSLHPYFTWMFDRVLHIAYLRRALRFSALFAAVALGTCAWSAAWRVGGKAAPAAVVAFGIIAAVASSLYPVKPTYFRRALSKATFIMLHRPSDGLFWHPDENAHRIKYALWDTEGFSALLKNVPLRETVLSDPFTSYRLTAYRDIYVMNRLKYSMGARDESRRENDAYRLKTAGHNPQVVCDLLRRYRSRWILLNIYPDYNIRGYFMWTPQTVDMLTSFVEYFEPVERKGPWVLLRATSRCAPWPPANKRGRR